VPVQIEKENEMPPDIYARGDDPETSHGYGDDTAKKFSQVAHSYLVRNDRPQGWTWWEVSQRVDLGQCPWHRFSDLKRRGLIARIYNEDGKLVKRLGGSDRPWPFGASLPVQLDRHVDPATVTTLPDHRG
jgi:hypothetical protein